MSIDIELTSIEALIVYIVEDALSYTRALVKS